MKLADKIYQNRKRMGLSQEELADRLGVTRQAVSKWEMGTSQPELDTVVLLAKTFGISIDELLKEETPQAEESKAETKAHNKDWLDRLPAFLGRMFRRYGWIAGVYIAAAGTGMLGLGALAKYISHKMVENFTQIATGITGWPDTTGGFGGMFDAYNQRVEHMMDSMLSFNPVDIVATVMMVVGIVLAVGGAVLAVILRKRAADK